MFVLLVVTLVQEQAPVLDVALVLSLQVKCTIHFCLYLLIVLCKGVEKSSRSECQACTSGHYSSLDGSSVCSTCRAGSFSLPLATTCSSCAAGSYNVLNGSETCIPCSPGKYAAASGSTACSTCNSVQTSDIVRINVTCSSTNDNNLCKMNNKCLNNECTQGIVGRFTPAEDYDNDEVMTITIVSVPPSTIILSFISFMTEPDYDVLEVFECPNATCLDASPPNVLSGKSSIPVPQISETGVMQLKWSSEVCCPKPSSACPCDDPSNANLLTGWLASFYVSGSTHCGPENPLSMSSRLEHNEFRQDGLPPIAGKAVETRTVVSRRQQTHAIHSVPRASQVMLDKYQRHQSIKEPGHALIPSKACQEGSVKRAPGPQRQNLFGSECHLFSRTSQTERKSQG
jgi:hypothetical protein